MWTRFTTATGALIAERLTTQPAEAEGVTVIEMPPSAVAGLTIWNATARGYVDPPHPLTRLSAPISLLLPAGTTPQAQVGALPPK